MAVTGELEEHMVEEGAQSVVIPSRNTEQAEENAVQVEGNTETSPVTEICALENGHVQIMVGEEPTMAEKVAMENYDVPAHVLAFVPPDGGCRAWIVMFASFLCNGIIFGTINSSGLIYDNLVKKLEAEGDSNAAFKTCKCYIICIENFFPLLVN